MQNSYQKIKEIILNNSQTTAKQLREELQISATLVHRHLKKLIQENIIQKIGSSPKVFYIPNTQSSASLLIQISSNIIEENWLEILPNGSFVYGLKGFELWCHKRNLDPIKQANLYEKTYYQKEKLKTNNLIDATKKIDSSFDQNYLEKLWYIDFYSWEIFGKTLLGKLILYAKQNSDLQLMRQIAHKIKTPIINLIQRENFDMLGTIPHSVPRKIDFLQTTLVLAQLPLPQEKLFEKLFIQHVVAQKTLKSKEDRQINATETLFLNKQSFPNKILLIDDACGSGSTLNIAAKKIKAVSPQTKIHALTFVGSINGFEVIKES